MQEQKRRKPYVRRATQLDSNEFDVEIQKLLKTELLEIEKYLKSVFLSRLKPEISLIISLLLFIYSLWSKNFSFGQKVLNVQYSNTSLTRQKRVWFIILSSFIPYLRDKFYYTSYNRNNAVRKILDKMEMLIKVGQFINFLVFLRQGEFPTLVHRLLGLKWSPTTKTSRSVGYSYMTRELMWHGFMELFMFVSPCRNYIMIKVTELLNSWGKKEEASQNVRQEVNTLCNICNEPPVYPYRISVFCQHMACYYCIKINILADSKYKCSTCGAQSTSYENIQ